MSAPLSYLLTNFAGLEMICENPSCGTVSSFAPYDKNGPIKGTVMQLAVRYGEAMTLDQLAERVVCPKCRGERFRFEPWAGRHGAIG